MRDAVNFSVAHKEAAGLHSVVLRPGKTWHQKKSDGTKSHEN